MKLAFTKMQGRATISSCSTASVGKFRWARSNCGACAAVVVGIRRGLLDARVHESMRGGDLTICWEGADNPVWMTGPAVTVFEGEIEIG